MLTDEELKLLDGIWDEGYSYSELRTKAADEIKTLRSGIHAIIHAFEWACDHGHIRPYYDSETIITSL